MKYGCQHSRLVHVLQDVVGEVLDGQHHLLTGRPDLGLGKREAISAFIPEFKGEGVFDALVVSPVVRASSSRICNVQATDERALHLEGHF